MLARQADTTVTINAGLTPATNLFLAEPGRPQMIDVRPEELVTLRSDKPIMVAQFIKGLVEGGSTQGMSASYSRSVHVHEHHSNNLILFR